MGRTFRLPGVPQGIQAGARLGPGIDSKAAGHEGLGWAGALATTANPWQSPRVPYM